MYKHKPLKKFYCCSKPRTQTLKKFLLCHKYLNRFLQKIFRFLLTAFTKHFFVSHYNEFPYSYIPMPPAIWLFLSSIALRLSSSDWSSKKLLRLLLTLSRISRFVLPASCLAVRAHAGFSPRSKRSYPNFLIWPSTSSWEAANPCPHPRSQQKFSISSSETNALSDKNLLPMQ